jgi:SAM-dependent methyltransferase
VFADLRTSPLANEYLQAEDLARAERYYPLTVFVCESCLLVQLPESESPESIFSDYAYFSSYSDSWLRHARRYVEEVTDRFALGSHSRVVEIASNDGYLLQYFVERGIPSLGIEPAANVARTATAKGIPTRVEFFGTASARRLAGEGMRADLLLGNNVLAHVPDLRDFVRGLALLLADDGVLTMEFPHLQRLIEQNQFDTIYHEHFSYFSFTVVRAVFASVELVLFDVEELPTHGGSLRIFARHAADASKPVTPAVERLVASESRAGLDDPAVYDRFAARVRETKRRFLSFLLEARAGGASIVGYGAAAKGNTLLNYCGVGTDLVDYVVDRSPHKQGRYLPGSRLPIYPPERIAETRPDYVLILPWNLKEEIVAQMASIRDWGGRFCVAIPELTVIE